MTTQDPAGLLRLVKRTANMGGCSQTHHEHLAKDARAALAATGESAPVDPSNESGLLWQDDCLCWHRCPKSATGDSEGPLDVEALAAAWYDTEHMSTWEEATDAEKRGARHNAKALAHYYAARLSSKGYDKADPEAGI